MFFLPYTLKTCSLARKFKNIHERNSFLGSTILYQTFPRCLLCTPYWYIDIYCYWTGLFLLYSPLHFKPPWHLLIYFVILAFAFTRWESIRELVASCTGNICTLNPWHSGNIIIAKIQLDKQFTWAAYIYIQNPRQ